VASVPTLSFAPAFGAELYGRAEELALIASALDDAPECGTTLVLRGEPGNGKSRLLDRARELALGRGMRVLATAGVEAESDLPYSALHRLVRPLLADLGRLPAPQQSMLLSAFGMAEHDGGDLFLVALGTLGLLANEAAQRPLVTVDDMHWLDAASRDAIAFVGRRLDSDPIVLLGAIREGYAAQLEVPEHPLPASSLRPRPPC